MPDDPRNTEPSDTDLAWEFLEEDEPDEPDCD